MKAGQSIGRYKAIERLGVGGMAEVWSVQHSQLRTRYACKVLLKVSDVLKQRLLREGLAQGRLHHANIVPVREVIDIGGTPALLMPLINGPSLDALLKKTTLKPPEALAVFKGIVAGVGHAHELGLVHRDLKPNNILMAVVDDALVPRVADFGLVKQLDGERFTRDGAMMGTPAYAAPEQLRDAANIDHRADLFSLGVLWVELMTGSRPFRADSIAEATAAHFDPPRLSELTGELRAIALRLLAIDPDDRLDDIPQLMAMLNALPIEPSLPSARLFVQSPQQTRALASRDTLPSNSPSKVPIHNVPARRDPFVGRDSELVALSSRVAAAGTTTRERLITLTGIGGTGKTRLCMELAWARQGDWSGIWWINLADTQDLFTLYATVSKALGFNTGRDPSRRIGEKLNAKGRALLVVDNFEQLTPFAEETIGAWMAAAPELVLLVTSRVPLRLPDEQVVPLHPMVSIDARELFIARARAAGAPEEVLEDISTIDRLVSLLDGLPLAIELAAARSRLYSPSRMLEMLPKRFKMLASRSPDLPDRHRTLRATLDWSWELLTPAERKVLAWSSVFEGGFTPEDAVEVIEPGAPELFVDEQLAALADHSLIRLKKHGGRVSMLVSVHEYAKQKLERDPEVAPDKNLLQRHAARYARYGHPLSSLYPRPRIKGRLPKHFEDLENLIAAVRRAKTHGDWESAGLVALASGLGIGATGPYQLWAELAGTALVGHPDGAMRASLLRAQAQAFIRLERHDEAEALINESVELANGLDDPRLQMDVLLTQGNFLSAFRRRPAEGIACLEEANRRRETPNSLTLLGEAYYVAGRRKESMNLFQRGLALAREVGDGRRVSVSQYMIGFQHRTAGNIHAALEALAEARAISAAANDHPQVGQVMTQEAYCYSRLGDQKRALQRAEEAVQRLDSIQDSLRADQAREAMANILVLIGRLDEAAALFEQLRERAAANKRRSPRLNALLMQTYIRLLQEDFDEAEALLARIAALLDEQPFPMYQYTLPAHMGDLHSRRGEYRAALENVAECRAAPIVLAQFVTQLCDRVECASLRGLGRLDEAAVLVEAAIAELGDPSNKQALALMLLERGRLKTLQGDIDGAANDLEASSALSREIGIPIAQIIAIGEKGLLPGQDKAAALAHINALRTTLDPIAEIERLVTALERCDHRPS